MLLFSWVCNLLIWHCILRRRWAPL